MGKLRIKKPKKFVIGPPPSTVRPAEGSERDVGVMTSGTGGLTDVPPPEERSPIQRLTVVEQIYHQQGLEGGEDYPHQFARDLKTEEQVYDRYREVATEEWQPMRFGWFSDKKLGCSMLSLVNTEGTKQQVNPTELEKKALEAKVIEICYKGGEKDPWLVPPKASTRLYPSSLEGLMIRCRKGVAKYTVIVFPE